MIVVMMINLGAVPAEAASPTTAHGTGATRAPTTDLPIAVSRQLSSVGPDPSILVPSSCTLHEGTLTARGTFKGRFVPEVYVRYGDVVELYAYTAPTPANGEQRLQVVELASERPFVMAGRGPWRVTGPVEAQVGLPRNCLVAVQSTHAFMPAGDAGS